MKAPLNPLSALTLAASLLALAPAQAAWPDHPITIVVPAAPGGTTDVAARLIAERASKLLEQSVVVENRAGAGGIIGAQRVARAAPDGYTLMMGNVGPNAINYSLYRNLPYKAQDFVTISNVVGVPNVFVVHANSPVKSIAELIQTIKSTPKGAVFGSSGTGQSTHITVEMFKQRVGVDAEHVPFQGSGPAVTALMGEQFLFMADNLPSSLPQIKAGRFRALAVTGAERSPQLPDVPTMAQAGVANMVVSSWFGLFAPAGTPADIVNRLADVVRKIVQTPEVASRLRDLGGQAIGDSPDDFQKFVSAEQAKWKAVIDKAGISLDGAAK